MVFCTTDYPVRIPAALFGLQTGFCGLYTICPGKHWDLTLKRVTLGPQKSLCMCKYQSYFRTILNWRFALNRPVTLPEDQAPFHSIRNLLLTNNHVVSNSELQFKKFSYIMVIKVAANGTHHKTYANISFYPPFAPSPTNFNMLYYKCTRVGTLIVATIYLQLIQNTYMFRSFTVLQCSHQHCVQPVASDVGVVGYL